MERIKRMNFKDESSTTQNIDWNDIKREVKPRARRMLGFAGNALVRRRK